MYDARGPRHRPSRRSRAAAVLAVVALSTAVGGLVQPTAAGAQPAPPSKPAIFHNGNWYLRDTLTTGVATSTFRYGTPGDHPVMGDWDGDGDDTVGIVRTTQLPSGEFVFTWHLRNTNSAGPATVAPFVFGDVRFVAVDQLGALPVVGDWDGDGDDTPGVMVYDFELDGPILWQLRNSIGAGAPDVTFNYSRGRDLPVVGDWDGDGDDSIGVVRGRTWLLRNAVAGGNADLTFGYGSSSYFELRVPGDWDGNGTDTPAVLRNRPPTEVGGSEVWLFRNSNSAGGANGEITFGSDAQTVDLPFETVPRLTWK